MNKLLLIHSSLNGSSSLSSWLASRFASQWLLGHPGGVIRERDLAADPVPHLTAEAFSAFQSRAEERDEAAASLVAKSDELIDEVRAADTLVLAVPMYNFSIPSTLKAWIDQLARAGETFRYTSSGPEGLLTGKRAVVFATRGGTYAGTPADTQTSYLKQFLAFVGITDVEFVYVEGLASDSRREQSLAQAQSAIVELGSLVA